MRMHMPVQVDGKSIPAYKALYVATVQDSSDTLDQASTLTHELRCFRTNIQHHVCDVPWWLICRSVQLLWYAAHVAIIDMHLCGTDANGNMHVQHDEASFKRKAKKSFTSALTQQAPAMLAPMTTSHAEALRRYSTYPNQDHTSSGVQDT